MAPKPATPLLGRLAVHLKMITMEQLTEVLHEQSARPDAKLGELLVERGFIDHAQLGKLSAAQNQVLAKHKAKRAGQGGDSAPAGPASAPAAEPAASQAKPAASQARSAPEANPPASEAKPAAVDPAVAKPAPQAAPAPPPASPARPQRRRRSAEETGPALGQVGDWAQPGEQDRERFLGLLREAVERGASDVHVHPGAPLQARIAGHLEALGDTPLEPDETERLLLSALDPELREQLAARGELDGCQSFEGVGRFRANFYREQRGLDGVLRLIPAVPPSLEELGLPARLAKFTTYHQGMVLVTGPSGCGKSSTLAALVNLVNEERREHILTIEDPIETLHPSKRCLVNQRSAGHHTESFARALRGALREDPDVIVIGELRDLETVSLALSAAETGHFVLATLHTDNAIRTVNRLVGSFPADEQDQVRAMLSESLKGVISQRLLARADGQGRVPALETMVVNRAVSNLIRENKTFQIHSILQTGQNQGMMLLDHSIRELVQGGVVTSEEASRHLEDPKALAA